MFFDTWSGLLRVLVISPIAYAALVAMLRISGNRTLSKMNAFDLVVTVALGSTLASTLLTKNVALIEGVLALGLLIGLQWIVAWLSVRSSRWESLVKSDAVLLVFRGKLLRGAMRQARLTEEEIRAALRTHNVASLADAEAVVLETDGTVTVLSPMSGKDGEAPSVLHKVRGVPAPVASGPAAA